MRLGSTLRLRNHRSLGVYWDEKVSTASPDMKSLKVMDLFWLPMKRNQSKETFRLSRYLLTIA